MDSILYGGTAFGGVNGRGALFGFNTHAGSLIVLPAFDRAKPKLEVPGDLTATAHWLYGYSLRGGADDEGCIFRFHQDGTAFEILHSFAGGPGDGAIPCARLIVTDSALYGIAALGGASNSGCVFRLGLRPEH
jgi:uncharacterized repeat protein (TIGR03803 family)